MKKTDFDLIVIGGGATGAGIALDASLRGLSVALFEQNDFGQGTSSRSTKLVHGGVRYLEAAVKRLNKAQYALVKEGLRERKYFLHNASHLAHPIALITPLYKWYEIPYIYAGLFLYDLISGKASLGKSRLLSASKAKAVNPSINPSGLKAAVSYYDGAFNDSRMVIALLQSAQEQGAELYNHHQVTSLLKKENALCGVMAQNKINGAKHRYNAKSIINATGPFADTIRALDDPSSPPIMQVSSGIHIVVAKKFLPTNVGLMIPQTSDGRVLFVLPYRDQCLIGTSDQPASLHEHPVATAQEITYLLENVNSYFDIHLSHKDILASFAGLRPLLLQAGTDTAQFVREHTELMSDSGLLTVAGGKWTSYRSMAEQAVDIIAKKLGNSRKCQTTDHKIIGSQQGEKYSIQALQRRQISPKRISYLYSLYGDRSIRVLEVCDETPAGHNRVHPSLETTYGELYYSLRYEYVQKPLDFITRRINIGLTDTRTSQEVLKTICDIMERELHWSKAQRNTLEKEAIKLC